uniref:Cytochrome c oxidase subunit 2 n=1 Tax=Auplopus sp. SJW-2017 TaxID=1940101 RepID=A0A1P8VH89_9HYME|nr:cytochrome c oxidase subunit 2 [Auplopus sp. SJW-2017]
MATWLMMNFQDPNSFSSLFLIWLHDYNMMILIITVLLIMYFIFLFFFNKFSSRNLLHGNLLEITWTILPMLVLYDMALPSLKILYFTENINLFYYSIKTIGHQWYWSYEFNYKGKSFSFDSYMISNNELFFNEYRLLDVDNRLILPVNVPIRNIISSMDVIHSWAMPSLGIKVDAIPGRLNQISIFPLRSGIFYGQCSEICGMNHSFMPIVLEITKYKWFKNWLYFMMN